MIDDGDGTGAGDGNGRWTMAMDDGDGRWRCTMALDQQLALNEAGTTLELTLRSSCSWK